MTISIGNNTTSHNSNNKSISIIVNIIFIYFFNSTMAPKPNHEFESCRPVE